MPQFRINTVGSATHGLLNGKYYRPLFECIKGNLGKKEKKSDFTSPWSGNKGFLGNIIQYSENTHI